MTLDENKLERAAKAAMHACLRLQDTDANWESLEEWKKEAWRTEARETIEAYEAEPALTPREQAAKYLHEGDSSEYKSFESYADDKHCAHFADVDGVINIFLKDAYERLNKQRIEWTMALSTKQVVLAAVFDMTVDDIRERVEQ